MTLDIEVIVDGGELSTILTMLSSDREAITGTTWNGPRFFGLRDQYGSDVPVEPAAVANGPSRCPARGSVRPVGGHSQRLEGRP